jgi:hypothetical protein
MGKISNLMMREVLTTKYSNHGILVVNVKINNTLISNTLINLGATINVTTRDTMQALGLIGLKETPIVVQPTDISTIKPKGILEYVVIFINSWEYPANFMVLQPKNSLRGYPLILGRHET